MTALLSTFYKEVFLKKHFQGKSKDVARGYRNSVDSYRKFLSREPSLDDLNPDAFEEFRQWLVDQKLAFTTRRGKIARLRTLWRVAHNLKKAGPVPDPQYSQLPRVPKSTKPRTRVLVMATEFSVAPPPGHSDTPREFIEGYGLETGIARNSHNQLRFRFNSFARFLQREPSWADFTDRDVNLWLATLLNSGLTPDTVRSYRIGLLTVWRSAYDHEILEKPPGRVRKIKVPSHSPKCWDMGQLHALLDMIASLKGAMQKCPGLQRSAFWAAWVLVGYYTGLRFANLLALRWSDVDADGVVSVVQQKTGDPIIRKLGPEAMASLKPLAANKMGERIFAAITSRRETMVFFRKIVAAAGLEGSTKWLRKTGASHAEASQAGSAKAFLGHRTFGLSYKHYIDPRIVNANIQMLPSIGRATDGKDGAR